MVSTLKLKVSQRKLPTGNLPFRRGKFPMLIQEQLSCHPYGFVYILLCGKIVPIYGRGHSLRVYKKVIVSRFLERKIPSFPREECSRRRKKERKTSMPFHPFFSWSISAEKSGSVKILSQCQLYRMRGKQTSKSYLIKSCHESSVCE
jgi:hypothetical protein